MNYGLDGIILEAIPFAAVKSGIRWQRYLQLSIDFSIEKKVEQFYSILLLHIGYI
jgi:hypothetical protein